MSSEAFQAVFATERGCVLRCRCCDRLQVLFGNALLSLDSEGFQRLRETVAEFDAGFALLRGGTVATSATAFDSDDAAAASPLSCRVVLHTRPGGAAYAFTRGDIAELRALVEGTVLLLELGADS